MDDKVLFGIFILKLKITFYNNHSAQGIFKNVMATKQIRVQICEFVNSGHSKLAKYLFQATKLTALIAGDHKTNLTPKKYVWKT